jgi:hypothetical protein
MKAHLLKCSQKHKNYTMEKELTKVLQKTRWRCLWASCSSSEVINSAEVAASHVSNHVTTDDPSCQWGPCNYNASSSTDFHIHLLVEHGVFTHMTIPTPAKFCIECGVWLSTELDWNRHVVQHVRSPDIIYGFITAEGIVAAPRQCPYCMMQGRFVQMENAGHYAEHIDDHIDRQYDKLLQNSALRQILGAFRGSPIKAMEIEAAIPPVHLRADKLCNQYAIRVLSLAKNHPIRTAIQRQQQQHISTQLGELVKRV